MVESRHCPHWEVFQIIVIIWVSFVWVLPGMNYILLTWFQLVILWLLCIISYSAICSVPFLAVTLITARCYCSQLSHCLPLWHKLSLQLDMEASMQPVIFPSYSLLSLHPSLHQHNANSWMSLVSHISMLMCITSACLWPLMSTQTVWTWVSVKYLSSVAMSHMEGWGGGFWAFYSCSSGEHVHIGWPFSGASL